MCRVTTLKIILVTPAVPHPFGDAAGRWFYVLTTELIIRGHDVVALAATEETEERILEAKAWLSKFEASKPSVLPTGHLTLHCHRLKLESGVLRRKWRNLVRPRSEMLQDPALGRLLQRTLTEGYDVLHLEQMSTGWLGLGVPRALLGVHFFDAIDWAEKRNMSLRDRKALWQARRATRHLLRAIPNVRFVTPRLKEMAQSMNANRNARYWVVPAALDTKLYEMQRLAQEPIVGLIGSMHWEPSLSAAERLITRIWPLVKRGFPEAKLHIAGWNAKRFLQKYASLPDLTLADNLGHPTEFFSKAAVMVYAPSRGSGMKVKVMEAMAYGVPVVTTWEGVEGIDCLNGRDCWVAEGDEELAEKACRLLVSPEDRQEMRHAARRLIEEKYSPRPVIDKMVSVYRQLIATQESPRASL